MNSPFVEKIKNIIDMSILKNFDVDDMEYSSYAPIAIKNGVVFTLISEKTNQRAVQSTIAVVLGNGNVKFKLS